MGTFSLRDEQCSLAADPEQDWKGKAGFFWGASSLMILIWAYFRLPECKGRSYRELDILFERGVPAKGFKDAIVDEEDES